MLHLDYRHHFQFYTHFFKFFYFNQNKLASFYYS